MPIFWLSSPVNVYVQEFFPCWTRLSLREILESGGVSYQQRLASLAFPENIYVPFAMRYF